ncbi:hypothetical protein TSUD_56280 [Trifolium subterraneum]|uniref:Uncharacterized protein n=1 Tax=Trifolium subterraneum TaxID=3900 RepID=A0A2Z6MT16_TRISU|nr:hypothetical protein TSUD_56280 [Trifolium subterraneum]
MDDYVTLILWHGGSFFRNESHKLEYAFGQMDVWEMVPDMISYFDLINMVKHCGKYHSVERVQWMKTDYGDNFDFWLRPLENDSHIIKMIEGARKNGNEVEIYFQHSVVENPEFVESNEDEMAMLEQVIRSATNPNGGSQGVDPPIQEDGAIDEEIHEMDFPTVEELIQQEQQMVEEEVIVENVVSKKKGKAERKSNKVNTKKSKKKSKEVLPPSESDSSSGGDDYHAEFREAAGHRETYSQNVQGEPSGEIRPTINDDEDDDLYHSEELKSPISTDDEDDGKHVFPQFNESAVFGEVQLEEGMKFPTLAVFKQAVKDYNINISREVFWVKNESYRARAKCTAEGCPWDIYCRRDERLQSFQVKTFKQDTNSKTGHSCSLTFTNKQAARKWVVKMLVDTLRIQPSITHAEIYDYFKREFNLMLDDSKINRAVREARELVEGYHGGQLLSAVGQDANNHIFVVAYAIVDVENKDNWKWFLILLHEDLGDYKQHGWNFMSDMQKCSSISIL